MRIGQAFSVVEYSVGQSARQTASVTKQLSKSLGSALIRHFRRWITLTVRISR